MLTNTNLEGDDALAGPGKLLHDAALHGKLTQNVGLRQHPPQRATGRQPVDERALNVRRVLALRLADDLPANLHQRGTWRLGVWLSFAGTPSSITQAQMLIIKQVT